MVHESESTYQPDTPVLIPCTSMSLCYRIAIVTTGNQVFHVLLMLSINKFTPSTCLPCSQIVFACRITLYVHSVDVSKPLRLSAATLPVISLLCGLVLSWAITLLFLGLLWQINCQPLSSTSFATTFRPPHCVAITHAPARFRCDPITFDLTTYPPIILIAPKFLIMISTPITSLMRLLRYNVARSFITYFRTTSQIFNVICPSFIALLYNLHRKTNSAQIHPELASITEFAGHTLAMSSSSSSIALSNRNWLADTGATSHMTPHRHWAHNYTPLHIPIWQIIGWFTHLE